MKVGEITTTNEKGQLVIPKAMRDFLGIEPKTPLNLILRGEGIYLYPIEEVISRGERESSYLDTLLKTQGAWAGDDFTYLEKRKKVEAAASKRRKQSW